MALYWVGSRESDIKYTSNLFSGAIVLYGNTENPYCLNGQKKIRIDNNIITDELADFLYCNMKKIISKDSSAQFYFYDPSWLYSIKKLEIFLDRCVCMNEINLISLFNDKQEFRSLISDKVPILPAKILYGNECNYENLCDLFCENSKEFVIQEFVSSGGEGTFLLNSHNHNSVCSQLDDMKQYIVTQYIVQNIPVNMHMLIDDEDIITFPGSIQLLRNEDNRIMYRGADYSSYDMLSDNIKSLFEAACMETAKNAQTKGYRGICGIDGIIKNNKVYILEFNARFQGSTSVLNKALHNAGLPSLQEMNLNIFKGIENAHIHMISELKINYCSYAFHNIDGLIFGNHILKNCSKESLVVDVDLDGYNLNEKINKKIYMYRMLIEGNISSVNADGGIYQHESVVEPDIRLYEKIINGDLLAIKISLMTLGVKITQEAKSWLIRKGGMRPGNNNAVDLKLRNIIINAPLDIKFIEFTPFEIQLEYGKLFLYYYEKKMDEIAIYPLDPLSFKTTSRGVPYTTVAYLSTDRLRVHMTNECIYKSSNKSCQFCNITPCKDPISIKDIREVVEDYIYNSDGATHFLVGGQSMGQEAGRKRIIEMVSAIRKHTKEKHIYVMSLPYDEETVKSLVDAGMNELSCNIEIFDDTLAKKYMPGKGQIPRETYFRVLSYARTLLPNKGDVRSMLILGLESEESFVNGVKKLFELGIQPIISIFRPLPNTPLENLIAPPLMYVYDMYYKLEILGSSQKLHLGPSCVHCQNNTLSLPH